MPITEFSPKNRVVTRSYDYPKLSLDNGERARIALLEINPQVEFVHTLQKPQIVDGKPKTAIATRKDGTQYEDYVREFAGRVICLGDHETLETQGTDPDKCPACKAAVENGQRFKAPQRRYAIHVIRYKTQSGGFKPVTPYNVEVLVWAFTDRTFNTLIDFAEEWEDLRKHDLLLGPCENKTFQKFDISVAATAEWLQDDARKSLTVETLKNNKIPDLTVAIGSKKEARWLAEDIKQIQQIWAQIDAIEGRAMPAPTAENTAALESGLDSLLGDLATSPETGTATPPQEATGAASEGSEPDGEDDTEASLATLAQASEGSATSSSEDNGITDLDSLLEGL